VLIEVFGTVKKSAAIPAVVMPIFAVFFQVFPQFEVVIAGATEVVLGRVPDVLLHCRWRVEVPVASGARSPVHIRSMRIVLALI
jgi:hypothetical protein